MTENEKLRALLAEARNALSQGCWSGKCCTVRKAIDAALAEPVQTEQQKFLAALAAVPACASGEEGHRSTCGCAACHQMFALLNTQPTEAATRAALDRVKRERDEARAEADKLRETLLSKHGGEPLALLRELDEARAEVERLKHQFKQEHHKRIAWMSCLNCGETRAEGDFWEGACPACPSEERQRRAASAYRRGAEAMREAAAAYLEEDAKFESMRVALAAEIYAGIIRALPVPEDE